ncbi:hypothetical protein [Candidatus Ichthyocystis sparus]|uniref:hypothetical protein n=1 Tax=Candidatus Ichthyocystis sparus TaxID=1561004 RepID=UPI000B834080|nr:hypothetical protein [Candidatus Ichthyocystis sparus]
MYTDIKFLNSSGSSYSECQLSDEFIEEVESESVIITEHKENHQPAMFMSFGKSLSSISMVVPIIISSLGGASGSQVSSSKISSGLCTVQQSLCDLIKVNRQGNDYINHVLESVFNESLNSLRGIPAFNFTKPLSIYQINSSKDDNKALLQLIDMSLLLNSEYFNLCEKQEKSGIKECKSDDSFCNSRGSMRFCNESYDIDYTFPNECCRSIFSYLLPIESSLATTTIAPEVGRSTTMLPEIMSSTSDKLDIVNSTTATLDIVSEAMNSTTVVSDLVSEAMNSTTVALEVVSEAMNSSTVVSEVMNFTTVESPSYNSTETTPINNGGTTLAVVLVALSSLVVVALSFMGYRAYKSGKPKQQHQPVPVTAAEEESLV